MLTKLKHFVPENVLYSLYCTLILPHVHYGVLIWGNTCKIYLDKIFKLQNTPGLCSQNIMFLMFMVHLNSILVYLCTNITQINFRQFFQRILLNMFKHTITQQEMPKIIVSIKQRKCFLIVQLEIVDLLFGILWTKL